MKKLLSFLVLVIFCLSVNAQTVFPINGTLGSPRSTVLTKGISAADSGFQYRTNFADTNTANNGNINQVPGVIIRTGSTLWIRNQSASAWVQIGSGASTSGITQLGTSAYGLTTQNDSTYKVDTSVVSTKLWRQKGIDSVQANVNLKLNISDTANMRPRLYAGSNVTITGTYPNLTIASTGGGSSDTSTFIIDTTYDALGQVVSVDTVRFKSIRIQAGGSTITPTKTDSTLSINIPEFGVSNYGVVPPASEETTDVLHADGTWGPAIDTTHIYTAINAKADTASMIGVDTTGSVDGYEAYLDKPNNTVKFRASTGAGGYGKLRFITGETTDAPLAGDSVLDNSNLVGKRLDVYLNGKLLDSNATNGYTYVSSIGRVITHPPLSSLDTVEIHAYDSASITYYSLSAPPPAPTTIAFVSAADGGNNSGATNSKTFSFTTSSGSDRVLLVGYLGDLSVDDPVGVTYDGVSMTFIAKQLTPSGRWAYLYYLLNPNSGAHDVVVSTTNNHWIIAGAAEYTGVQGLDVTTTNSTSGTALTTSLTTTVANCWTFLFAGSTTTITAGAGSTARANASINLWRMFDSNGPKVTPGSTSMSTTGSQMGHIMIALKPY